MRNHGFEIGGARRRLDAMVVITSVDIPVTPMEAVFVIVLAHTSTVHVRVGRTGTVELRGRGGGIGWLGRAAYLV